jgi:phenylacetate-CoA ligase
MICSQLDSVSQWASMPTSQKSDWLGDSDTGVALHHSFDSNTIGSESRAIYQRYHRTSGTKGKPMVILDTSQDWQWWIDTWQYVLDACGIHSGDRIMMAFSFGPFIGFWSAHDACLARGCMVIPCGGMSTVARIDMIQSAQPTVLFSTPSYAMHLAHDAACRGIDLTASSIRQVFVAGEPGGSVPAIRSKIEAAYNAQLMDHAGATEVGPWGFGATTGDGLHVIESEFIAEFEPIARSSIATEDTLEEGICELVLTSLGRIGAPVLRYRTGDLVRPVFDEGENCRFVRLHGGVLGRVDDMIVVRGVNVFPSSIDAIMQSFEQVDEYRLTVSRDQSMDQLTMEIEPIPKGIGQVDRIELCKGIAERLAVQLNLRFEVHCVEPLTLPRSEGKAKRIFDRR